MHTPDRSSRNPRGAVPSTSGRPFGRWGHLSLAMLVLVSMLALSATVAAQGTIVSTSVGDVPTTGGMRPGPVGMQPATSGKREGIEPTALLVEKAGIDAAVERLDIADGVMLNPSGPFVVGWYQETAKPGGPGNAVMAGHVDYWNVGEAVFWELPPPREVLTEGDPIVVVGSDGTEYTYAVEWQKLYNLDELTVETINGEIVGPTDAPSLTLITCGGDFDPVSGQYLSRYVVRAKLVS